MQLVGRCARRYIDAIAHTCAHHGRYVPMRNREYACAPITAPARTLAHTQSTGVQVHKCTTAVMHARSLVWMRARTHPHSGYTHPSHSSARTDMSMHARIQTSTRTPCARHTDRSTQARRHAGTRVRLQTGAWCMVHGAYTCLQAYPRTHPDARACLVHATSRQVRA